MSRARGVLVWAALAAAVVVPIAAAATSPLLQWRGPVYIAAGFAGVAAMALLVIQPLLAGGYLPGLSGLQSRRLHRWVGASLVAAVVLHVAGLWVTSPPDVVDVLLFRSPTPFSEWGAIAMWAVLAAGLLAVLRRRIGWRPRVWRLCHATLAAVTVLCAVMHALLIEGTMETVSKVAICVAAVIVTVKLWLDLRLWSIQPRR